MARFVPKYDNYSVDALLTLTERELKQEYTRMRDVAQKRIKRLLKEFPEAKASQHKVELKNEKGETIREYVGFRELKDLRKEDIPKALSEMFKFVNAKTSTVQGQRAQQRKTISTLNKAIGAGKGGQAGVTKENYWRVIKILEESRKRKITYGSDKIVTLAETTLNLNNDQFDDVINNLAKMLENADELGETLSDYMSNNDIRDYQKVDMSEFIKDIGW